MIAPILNQMNNVEKDIPPKIEAPPIPRSSPCGRGLSGETSGHAPGTQSEVRVASRPDVRVFELRVRKPELW